MDEKTKDKVLAGESVFTGSMFGLLGIDLVTLLFSVLTIGLAFPWLICWKESWYAEHTYINGRRLEFDGTGMQLFGNWIKWVLLSVITLGIYLLWVPIKLEKWRVKHLHFADEIVVTTTRSVEPPAKMDSTVRCPYCGYENKSGAKYCAKCAAKLEKEPMLDAPVKNAKKYCPACGSEVPVKAKFCGNCATKLDVDTTIASPIVSPDEGVKRCARCGKTIYGASEYCSSCEASMETIHTPGIGLEKPDDLDL